MQQSPEYTNILSPCDVLITKERLPYYSVTIGMAVLSERFRQRVKGEEGWNKSDGNLPYCRESLKQHMHRSTQTEHYMSVFGNLPTTP